MTFRDRARFKVGDITRVTKPLDFGATTIEIGARCLILRIRTDNSYDVQVLNPGEIEYTYVYEDEIEAAENGLETMLKIAFEA